MIVFLEGTLIEKSPAAAIVDVHGVGYEILISLSTYDRLPATGSACKILTHHHIREDIQQLFGFATADEKTMFLRLINVNIQDITDESGYIAALGKEAAARAINEAKIKVAEKERDGEIGQALAQREQRVQVAAAHATAVEGENIAGVRIAQSSAARREKEAEAQRIAVAAEKVRAAQALQEAYAAEETAERQRANREQATQTANIIVPAEIEKRRIETIAEAEAEKIRRIKKGEADGVRFMMEAEAAGIRAILSQKAEGIQALVHAAGGDPHLASLLMITEQMPKLVAEQVKAISNLKIDKINVWETGRGGKDGKNSTADFVSGLIGVLPPLHDITKNIGLQLPQYLGKMVEPMAAVVPEAPKPADEPAPAPEPPAQPPPAASAPKPSTPPPASEPPPLREKPRLQAPPPRTPPPQENISFRCTYCGQSLFADAAAAGQLAKCPKCTRMVKIPGEA
jgi:flotillin